MKKQIIIVWLFLIFFLTLSIPYFIPLLAKELSIREKSSIRERTGGFRGDINRKIVYFRSLSNHKKIEAFSRFNDEEKIEIFNNLSDEDKIEFFKVVGFNDKKILFRSISESEKNVWKMNYPGLEFFITSLEEEDVGIQEEKEIEAVEKDLEISDIERVMSGKFPSGISPEIRQFGYNYFSKDFSTFAPVSDISVGPDYIIGPGDSFTIHLWGKAEDTYKVVVTRDGNITIPRIGTLTVSGLTFDELKRHLFEKFKSYYPDFKMSITMDSLRTIDIFLMGEVENSGTYTVSSLSTIVSALFSAGGPTKNGSLRRVQLIRNGKTFRTIDLYDFFIKGTKRDDLRLRQGDTVFVPIRGPVAGVAGRVKRPAIYEMKEMQTIGYLIEIAGGVLPTGNLQNVVIERVQGHKRRVIKSFNLDPSHERSNENLQMSVKDGDVIKIYPVYNKLRQVVFLEGHVKYPREYELKPGMRLYDIIPSYDSLLPEPYLPQAEIIRLMPPDLHPEIIEFGLGALMRGAEDQNLLLKDQDRIIVYDRWEKKEVPEVFIEGAVRNPGTYRLYAGMTVKDLIFQAGNIMSKAYMESAELTRLVSKATGADIIKLSFSPQRAIEGIPEDDLVLQENDQIHIREIPKYEQMLKRKIVLEGEFIFPGEYAFNEGERLSSVIERAGGFTNDAYLFGAIFLRESVKKIQKERLNEYISKLEQDILSASTVSAEKSLDKDESLVLAQTLNTQRALLGKLRTSQPTGRMVINLDELSVLASSKYNFQVRPGDRLIVKERLDFVNVMGEVYNPTALFVEKGRDVEHYLSLVGGVSKNADKKEIYIIKANGAVVSRSQGGFFGLAAWDQGNRRWSTGSFNSIKLNPGDTIIVPQKIMTYPWMRFFQDTTEILYQLAVTAGVLDSAIGIF
ncbi:MAG: SLBB domain-containing protein [Deltaproteobacteria bacterium]|nr:SLBB domain-containing protein [Deltaproteobacteria bacterium]